MNRIWHLTNTTWFYLLGVLKHPKQIPFIAWQIFIKRVHLGELLNLNRYKTWLRENDIKTVIDVGGHKGEFASAIRAILPDAQIYSFEPLPECYQKLSKRLMKYEKFKAYRVALGELRKEVTFWECAFTKSSSILSMTNLHKKTFPWTSNNTALTVQMEKLDDYIDRINLEKKIILKLDVQGYQDKVLKGGKQILKKIDFVLVETSFKTLYEGEPTFDAIYKLLIEEGFKYAGNFDQMLSPLDQTIMQADALFIRNS